MEKHNQSNTHESFYIKTPIGHPNKGKERRKKREQGDQREKERCNRLEENFQNLRNDLKIKLSNEM